jgi:PhzF family phenazine biosynthesis protein
MARATLYLVDAFAERPFAGNPAAVCVLAEPAEEDLPGIIAAELNQPATTFVWPMANALGLRWFSPTTELALCGHGTLATAHVLWETGRLAPEATADFETRAGRLVARRVEGRVELDFPAEEVTPAEAPPELLQALGATPIFVGRTRRDYLVELGAEAEVRALAPDYALLRQVQTRGLIVTSRATMPGFDVVSRFFAPSVGIGEDAVTGSAHCAIGPYWLRRLGQAELRAYQASARGGVLRVRVANDRAFIAGHAVTVLRGEIEVPLLSSLTPPVPESA